MARGKPFLTVGGGGKIAKGSFAKLNNIEVNVYNAIIMKKSNL